MPWFYKMFHFNDLFNNPLTFLPHFPPHLFFSLSISKPICPTPHFSTGHISTVGEHIPLPVSLLPLYIYCAMPCSSLILIHMVSPPTSPFDHFLFDFFPIFTPSIIALKYVASSCDIIFSHQMFFLDSISHPTATPNLPIWVSHPIFHQLSHPTATHNCPIWLPRPISHQICHPTATPNFPIWLPIPFTIHYLQTTVTPNLPVWLPHPISHPLSPHHCTTQLSHLTPPSHLTPTIPIVLQWPAFPGYFPIEWDAEVRCETFTSLFVSPPTFTSCWP